MSGKASAPEAEHDPGRARNKSAINRYAESTDRSQFPPKRRSDLRTLCYKLPQEAFLGVVAFNFGQRRRRRKETALSRIHTDDLKNK